MNCLISHPRFSGARRAAVWSLRLLLTLAAASPLSAQVALQTTLVDAAGNAADTTGYGAVASNYHIGVYEVTNHQYTTFLNAVAASDPFGLYNDAMAGSALGGITRSGDAGSYSYATRNGYADQPVVFVSFWDAARYVNWLGTGGTESGAYSFSGSTSSYPITRTAGARFWIPNQDEWYKAAYYDPATQTYSLHPTRSSSLANNTDFLALNGANYYDGDYAAWDGTNNGATDVGTYANATSYFGTFDQAGNVWEWTDSVVLGSHLALRGGGWSVGEGSTASTASSYLDPSSESSGYVGFRVASLTAVPEPSTYAMLFGLLSLGVVAWRRWRAR